MPRANRHFLPGHLRRITHRCQRNLFKTFKPSNRYAPFKTFEEMRERKLLRFSRLVTFDQKVNVVGRHHVIEHRQTEPLLCFENPTQIAPCAFFLHTNLPPRRLSEPFCRWSSLCYV
jgi:hypothetical protein